MALIDHLTLNVSDYARSRAFYEKALAPLGVKPVMEFGEACGFGRDQKPDFWIGKGPTSFQKPEHLAPITPVHVALSARTRDEVRAFHAAALAAGATDHGAPGLRRSLVNDYRSSDIITDAFILRADQAGDDSNRVNRRQGVHNAHQIAEDCLLRADRPPGIGDHTQMRPALSGSAAIPNRLKK